jgi:hypothetical protein
MRKHAGSLCDWSSPHANQAAEKVLRGAWPRATTECMLLILRCGAGPCPAKIADRKGFFRTLVSMRESMRRIQPAC